MAGHNKSSLHLEILKCRLLFAAVMILDNKKKTA
jgi:hypothetical protein